ncbi:hypothetical protein M8818_005365 [Zalaria obscura]|uniref:Uncharacterized protein n=1 Tax=Zalaria obscura TaxID=2024903 RepID=A0ACC3S9M7_9PEZI
MNRESQPSWCMPNEVVGLPTVKPLAARHLRKTRIAKLGDCGVYESTRARLTQVLMWYSPAVGAGPHDSWTPSSQPDLGT